VFSLSKDLSTVIEDSARGSFFLATGNVVATVISALSVFIVARLLGPQLYGVYTITLAVPSLLLIFTGFGIDEALTRFSANLRIKGENQSLARTIRLGVTLRAITGIAMFTVCYVFSDYLAAHVISRPEYGIYVRLASIVILLQAILYSTSAVFVGLDRTEYSAIAANVQAIIKTVLAPLLIIAGFSVVGAITGFTISCLAAGLLSAGLLFIKLYKPLKSENPENPHIHNQPRIHLKTMLKYGFPLYISTLLYGASTQLRTVVLSFFTLDLDIGNFKAATNFVTLMVALSGSIATALFPAFSKLDRNGSQAKTFFKITTKYTSMLLVPASVVLIIFSKELVKVVYGEAFLPASLFLALYITVYFLAGLGSLVQGSFFNGLGETKTTLKMNLASFVMFLGLAPLLTQAYNVPGLIIAILVSNLTATIFGAYIAKSNFGAEPEYALIFRIYVAAFASAVPSLFIAYIQLFPALVTIFLGGFLYLLAYITILPILGVLSKLEIGNLQKTTGNIRFLKHVVKPILMYENKLLSHTRERHTS